MINVGRWSVFVLVVFMFYLAPIAMADSDNARDIGFWQFERNAADSSGAGNDGEGYRVRYGPGAEGFALRAGNTGYVVIESSEALDARNGIYINLLLRLASHEDSGTLVGRGIPGEDDCIWALYTDNRSLILEYTGTNEWTEEVRVSLDDFPLDTWIEIDAFINLPESYMAVETDYGSTWAYELNERAFMDANPPLYIGDAFEGSLDEVLVSRPWDE